MVPNESDEQKVASTPERCVFTGVNSIGVKFCKTHKDAVEDYRVFCDKVTPSRVIWSRKDGWTDGRPEEAARVIFGRLINKKNVRSYDCKVCKLHFEAETPHGDAHEHDPDCPGCGDPTGFNCAPCFGDPHNQGFPAVSGSPQNPDLVDGHECLFPNNKYLGVVLLPLE